MGEVILFPRRERRCGGTEASQEREFAARLDRLAFLASQGAFRHTAREPKQWQLPPRSREEDDETDPRP